jgi:recombination protein RecA
LAKPDPKKEKEDAPAEAAAELDAGDDDLL